MEYVPCRPEICSNSCQLCEILNIEVGMMYQEVEALEERLHQIKSISLDARSILDISLDCKCSEALLNAVLSAIETITEHRYE